MTHPVQLSDAELRIVLELLDAERRNLPAEIHHTDSPKVEEELKQRKRVVDQLVTRLQSAEGQA
jgi:hypothetical protein